MYYFLVYDKFDGWCLRRRGSEVDDVKSIKEVNSAEECVKAAIRDQKAKGAIYRARTNYCAKVFEKITSGSSERGYECFRFRVGIFLFKIVL